MITIYKLISIAFGNFISEHLKVFKWTFILMWLLSFTAIYWVADFPSWIQFLAVLLLPAWYALAVRVTKWFIARYKEFRFLYEATQIFRCYELFVFIAVCKKFNYNVIILAMECTTDTWNRLHFSMPEILAEFLEKEGLYDYGDKLRRCLQEYACFNLSKDEPDHAKKVDQISYEILSHKKKYFALVNWLPAKKLQAVSKAVFEVMGGDSTNFHNVPLSIPDKEVQSIYLELVSRMDEKIRADDNTNIHYNLTSKIYNLVSE